MNTVKRWKNFNEEVREGLIAHAKNKGWKVMKSSEPKFKKGNAEVYMHTDDAVIFSTINNKLVGKNYKQDMHLFSGDYQKNRVRKYINQGKASITFLDKKLGGSKTPIKQRVRRKLRARRTAIPRATGGIGSSDWIAKETGGFG